MDNPLEALRERLKQCGLTDQKWFKMFHRMKVYDTEEMEDKEVQEIFDMACSFNTSSSEIEGLKTFLNLKISEKIDIALEEVGLEVEYWSRIFKEQLRCLTVKGLSRVSGIFYPHLVQYTRSPKERKCLQILLKLKDSDTLDLKEHYTKMLVSIRDRQSELLLLMKRVRELKLKTGLDTDEVKNILEEFTEILQVPEEFCFPNCECSELLEIMEQLNEALNFVADGDNVNDREIAMKVAKATFKGVFKSQNDDAIHANKDTVEIQDDVIFQLPFHSQGVNEMECSGKDHENMVLKELVSMKNEIEQSVAMEQYVSTVKIIVIPMASCCLNPKRIKLTNGAIKALKLIEESNYEDILLESFLIEYGSHLCLGTIHFGGTYILKCYTYEPTKIDEARRLQHRVINTYTTLLKPPKISDSDVISAHCGGNICPNTYIEVTTNGGVEPPVSVAVWKNKLMIDKRSWVLLDQGGTEYYPIWEFLKMSHEVTFNEPLLLAEKLESCWMEIKSRKQKIECYDKLIEEVKNAVDILIKDTSFSNCIEGLSQLVKFQKLVIHESMNVEIWPKYFLSIKQVQKYLNLVVEVCRNQIASDQCKNIKHMLCKIAGPIDIELTPDFDNKRSLLCWMLDTDDPNAVNNATAYIENCFAFALDESKTNMFYYELVNNPDTMIRLNAIALSTLVSVRKCLSGIYDQLFVTTIVFPCRYGTQNTIYLRGLSDLKMLCGLFKEHTKEYIKVRDKGNLAMLQVHLLLLAIVIGGNHVDLSMFPRMCDHLKLMLEMLDNATHPVVKDAIHSIISGQDTKACTMYLKSINIQQSLQCDRSMTQKAKQLTPEQTAKNFKAMLIVFDMLKLHPQKFTLLQALEVYPTTIDESSKCSNRKLYPIVLLQKLFSFDHRCFLKLTSSAIKDMDFMSSDLRCASFISVENEKLVATINPHDGLITILLCADNFLRQDIVCRLATCQIAIPLILPDPLTGTLTLPIWSMRTIVKEWENEGQAREVSILSYPMPKISFLRFGCHKRSKSKLLNIIINNNTHDTFFHYDCGGGSVPKLLSQGLIDMSWLLPSSENESFSEPITIMNLHGDARNFPVQIKFLKEVSFMHFIMLSTEDLDEIGHEILKELSKAPGGVVLLNRGKEISEEWNTIDLESINEDDLRQKIVEKIRSCIAMEWDSRIIPNNSYVNAAHRCKVNVDEDERDCSEAESFANEFKLILDKLGNVNPKDQMELQGPKYWHKISANRKALHSQRQTQWESFSAFSDRINLEIKDLRKGQYDIVMNIKDRNELLGLFVSVLKLTKNRNVRRYYLHWLRIYLDDYSRDKLPPLQREYKQKKVELRRAKEQKKAKIQQEIENLNEKLISSSFGLEHLLREIGQIYESSVFFSVTHHDFLPRIAAELFVEGHPLELMDGDASHIPMMWIKAVLSHAKVLLNDPSMIVLSIIGVQSSGKSTLLNALFGVKFSVSAGRCTRGAFMQLIPFHKSYEKARYLLLIDTEGLRAPELEATNTHDHDNQLGTFVIGLANLTLINIFGESSTDMNDMLQTAVHAFIRMKDVTGLSPVCHFVHQNVSSVMAHTKGMVGRTRIIEHLNKMTELAAEHEGLKTVYTCFNDVIHFDDEKDVTCFPGLWFGNPPMAPVNTRYSTMARNLRTSLINFASNCKPVKLSDYSEYLKQLWDAILCENFIFSFRNTQQMSVFSALDWERSKWFWEFRKEMMTSEDEFETKVSNIREINADSEKVYKDARKAVLSKLTESYDDILIKVKQYFSKNQHREILVTWEEETKRLLNSLKSELELHAKQCCIKIWRSQVGKNKVIEIKSKMQDYITERVKTLVLYLDLEEKTDMHLKVKFEEQWKEWVKNVEDVLLIDSHKSYNIEEEFVQAIVQHFQGWFSVLKKKLIPELGGKPLDQWDIECFVLTEKHVRISSLQRFLYMVRLKREQWRPLAEEETNHYIREVQKCVMSKAGKDFNPSFIMEILTRLNSWVSNFKSDIFQFSTEYKIDIALTACSYASKQFKIMAERYRMENDPVYSLEKDKSKYFQDFCDEFRKTAQEKIAARQCCELVETAVANRITKSLPLTVMEKMRKKDINSFLFTKRALLKNTLKRIGTDLQKRKFDLCSEYLRYPNQAIQNYVKLSVQNFCDSGHPTTNLTLYAKELLIVIMKFVKEAVSETRTSQMSVWITEFKSNLSQKLVVEGDIRCSVDANCNVGHFCTNLRIMLEELEQRLSQKYLELRAEEMENWEQKPYDMIFEQVIGCKEVCPFCKEPCIQHENHSGNHSVDQHHPECLGGWRIRATGKMSISTCNQNVNNDNEFYISPNSDELCRYRECEKIYPNWKIEVGLSKETSLFWKYVVAHFKGQLARLYNMEEEVVPNDWTGFELSQAIDALD